MGTVHAICYQSGGPPDLPLAVMVKFDSYSGPALYDNSVPIIPLRCTWFHNGVTCSRLQLPLKRAWAVTIHKAQGLTMDKVVVDVGKKEFSAGLTFVACSRVRHLSDLAFVRPFDYQRLSTLASSRRVIDRRLEDTRLRLMEEAAFPSSTISTSPPPSVPSPPSDSSSPKTPSLLPSSECSSAETLPLPPPSDCPSPPPNSSPFL